MDKPFSISESSGGARQKDDSSVAVYDGAFAEYEFFSPRGMDGYVVVTHKTRGGSDLLAKSVKKLVFSDCEKTLAEVVPTRPWEGDEIKKPSSNLNSNLNESKANEDSNLNLAPVLNLNSNLNIAPQNNPNFKPAAAKESADDSNLKDETKDLISLARISNLNEPGPEPKKPAFEIIEEADEPLPPEEKDFEGDFFIVEEEPDSNLKGGAQENTATNLAASNLKLGESKNPNEYFEGEDNPLKSFLVDPAHNEADKTDGENLALEFDLASDENDKSQTPGEAYNFGANIAAPSVVVRDVKVYIANFDESSDGFYFSHFPEGALYKYSISQNEFFAHFVLPNLNTDRQEIADFLCSLTFRTTNPAPKKFIVLLNDVPYFYDAT